ncbi:hypothetical protein V6N12_035454 [Hibiscus sabdariffa]|uniref:Retrotransposon protein, putative, Ty1-copia subclass n=1 Tax=Hibiscus sabdariffa TaxID=183260 RepID=A0ABR2EMT0_9ROSI
MYAMICTRPDLSYALSMTSRYQANPGEGHWTAVKNILKYLRRTKDVFLVYGGEEELRIKGYTDASFQTDKDDSRSQSGFVFYLNGGAVSWKSSKQDTVADSTTEAEYIAASEAAKEAVWIKKFITGLGVIPSISDAVDLYCDNNGAIAQAKEPRSHQRSKHILRRFHLIREIIDRGDVEICKVHKDDNIADPLTKPLAQQKHDRHTESLGIRYVSDWLFGKEFPSSCSLVYSGGLSRDLDEIFVEIQDPRPAVRTRHCLECSRQEPKNHQPPTPAAGGKAVEHLCQEESDAHLPQSDRRSYKAGVDQRNHHRLQVQCGGSHSQGAFPYLISALCRRAAVPAQPADKYTLNKSGWTRKVYMRKMEIGDAVPIQMAMPTPPASEQPEPVAPAGRAPSPAATPPADHATSRAPTPAATPATQDSRQSTPPSPMGSAPTPPLPPPPA